MVLPRGWGVRLGYLLFEKNKSPPPLIFILLVLFVRTPQAEGIYIFKVPQPRVTFLLKVPQARVYYHHYHRTHGSEMIRTPLNCKRHVEKVLSCDNYSCNVLFHLKFSREILSHRKIRAKFSSTKNLAVKISSNKFSREFLSIFYDK